MPLVDSWTLLAQIVALLSAATLLGLLARRLGQDPVIGYLGAGILLGPVGLRLAERSATVEMLAELGVALLLFTIGLELSVRRLCALGGRVALAGILQILGSTAVAQAAGLALGLRWETALVIGMVVALSSTAVVLRLVSERSELDSQYGRTALGILLLQDVAVFPAVLLISILGGTGRWQGGEQLLWGLLKASALLAGLYALMRWLLPALMLRAGQGNSRDLPVLLSVTVCLGGSWTAHGVGLSPVLGAFAAGILLAESPFAGQVRADVIPLRAAFLTLFFSSIGLLAALPSWRGLLGAVVLAATVVLTKAAVVVAVSVMLRMGLGNSVRAGLALAQIGEFSFVLLQAARREGLLGGGLFELLVSSSVATLLLTPYLIRGSAAAAGWAEEVIGTGARSSAASAESPAGRWRDHVVVVGFGPAGLEVSRELRGRNETVVVLDANPRTAVSSSADPPLEYGDATQPEVLERVAIRAARAVVVTVPDPYTARLIVSQVRRLAPRARIITRARYHLHQGLLWEAGSDRVVSEELVIGQQLARDALADLASPSAG